MENEPHRLLIVDDDKAIWQTFSRTLTREGYECRWAANVAEARQIVASQTFDLVLLDIVMPGESGLAFGRYLRETSPGMPVVYVTGLSSMETAREALSMDIYGYIVKPVDRSQILISVANALKRKELETKQKAYRQHLELEVQKRTKDLVASNVALKNKEALLSIKAEEQEQLNNALTVLLKKQKEDRTAVEAQMLFNVHKIIKPYLDKLKACRLSEQQLNYVEMIENGIDDIVSSFSKSLSAISQYLTPSEYQVADLIRQGKSTKEISALLNLSDNTIMTHRYKIRTKLGLKNSKQNLRSYLSTFSNQ